MVECTNYVSYGVSILAMCNFNEGLIKRGSVITQRDIFIITSCENFAFNNLIILLVYSKTYNVGCTI